MEQEGGASSDDDGPKRLHISNIPFRFREADLRGLLSVSRNHVFTGTHNLLKYLYRLCVLQASIKIASITLR